jgi:hypothetical protein
VNCCKLAKYGDKENTLNTKVSVGTIANNVENAKTAAESKPFFAFKCIRAEDFLFQQLLPQNYEVVNHYIHQFIASAQKLKGISVLFLLVAVFFLFHEVLKHSSRN